MINKEELERQIFLEFADAARLGVEPNTVKSEKPPLPDISCEIDGFICYFELTMVADQAIANHVGHMKTAFRQAGKSTDSKTFSYSDREIIIKAVSEKAKKNHKTNGCLFALLIYCDGYFHPRIRMDLVRESIKNLEKEYANRWNKIWLYDKTSNKILWPENYNQVST